MDDMRVLDLGKLGSDTSLDMKRGAGTQERLTWVTYSPTANVLWWDISEYNNAFIRQEQGTEL